MTETIDKAAERMWPGVTYDTALPERFVDRCLAVKFDPRGCVVWAYPEGYIFGMPLPLTHEAVSGLCLLAASGNGK